jgi:hypothetical protein
MKKSQLEAVRRSSSLSFQPGNRVPRGRRRADAQRFDDDFTTRPASALSSATTDTGAPRYTWVFEHDTLLERYIH